MSAAPEQVAVAVEDGAVALGGRPVLRGVNLEVHDGDFLALLGANGSGKSTLVRTMLGLHQLSAGEVRLFGTPLAAYRSWSRIGYVPQRPGAATGIPVSVWEVVAAGRLTRRRMFRPLSGADRTAIRDALAVVGLADRERDTVSHLSGGQQQRVLIARALAGEPDLFFLDEPTAGVDVANQQILADTLAALKERGATIVLVAHELGPLAPLVDRAVVMRDGRVAYDGPPLTDADTHAPWLAEPHTHHHAAPGHHDHAPEVRSPLDQDGHHR